MLEKCSGMKWEDLMVNLSNDLNLGIHIGWPDSNDPKQPQGHINPANWKIDMEENLIPIPKVLRNYHYFNQYVLLCTPAGNTSITISGFLKFLKLNIQGLNGKDNYLKSETIRHIITCYPDYSLGWAAELFGHTYYHHRGSAGTFNSIAIIVPEYNMGIVIMTNTYDGEAMNDIAKLLIHNFAR
jgi:CubicO group peptidase (beta-lactamase class C family)